MKKSEKDFSLFCKQLQDKIAHPASALERGRESRGQRRSSESCRTDSDGLRSLVSEVRYSYLDFHSLGLNSFRQSSPFDIVLISCINPPNAHLINENFGVSGASPVQN